jgi:hypothetical protein
MNDSYSLSIYDQSSTEGPDDLICEIKSGPCHLCTRNKSSGLLSTRKKLILSMYDIEESL